GLPSMLNEPAPKLPTAHSWSVQAARVTAAPTPSTSPPARSARTLRPFVEVVGDVFAAEVDMLFPRFVVSFRALVQDYPRRESKRAFGTEQSLLPELRSDQRNCPFLTPRRAGRDIFRATLSEAPPSRLSPGATIRSDVRRDRAVAADHRR